MTRRSLPIVLLLVLVLSFLPAGSAHAQGTDVIREYTIDIVPREDGTLVSTYTIDWCVISDAAGPLTWFTVGMPNEDFKILSYSGDAATVKPEASGFDYLMRVDLSRSANAGDCVNVSVQVQQYQMAYQYEETGEVFYQFTPGWFDEIPVEKLRITWALPSEPVLVKSFDPQPGTKTDTQAIWESSLDEGDKYTVSLFYDSAAFPRLDTDLTASGSTESGGTDSEPAHTGSTSAANVNSPAADVAPSTGIFESISISVCGCIILILVVVVLIVIFSAMMSAARVYRGGRTFGGYRGGGWSGGSSRPSGGSIFGSGGGSIGRSSRSGGGSGMFGGRGSSCACVSSGCACACAGGGRAGCSRKGFDVSGLFRTRKAG